MSTTAERTAALRNRCLARKTTRWWNIHIDRAASLRASAGPTPWIERQGLALRDVLPRLPFAVDELELLLGRLGPMPAGVTREANDEAKAWIAANHPRPDGQTGHCELDLEPLFDLGIDGLQADLRRRLALHADPGRQSHLRAFGLALEGLSGMNLAAARCAREAMAGASAERRAELAEMAAIAERVAHHPPRTFREAIQLMWLVILAVQVGETVSLVGPGRIDRSLIRFYRADLAAGRLDRDRALELIEHLYIQVNELVEDGLAVPVMCGGRDAEGADATNELSYLALEALRRTRLVYPTVGVCWHEGTPQDLTGLAVDLIAGGLSTPAFFGDETIQRGLRALGVPATESYNYINSTCVEITPVGASNVWVASPYFNTCELLLAEIAAGATAPPPSFEDFLAGFRRRIEAQVVAAAGSYDHLRRERQRLGGKPLQSVFTRDCVGRALDIDHGGALYNWVENSFLGLANLADSLHVIRQEVYVQRRTTLARMHEVLGADFAGAESERLRWLNGHAKYGQDDPAPDGLFSRLVEMARELCAPHRIWPDGSPFVPGAFAWEMHERLGRVTGATPDGRRANTPFADGAGPVQGRETRGPTAAILSTTSWDHAPLIGGVAFNMKFNTSLFAGPEGKAGLTQLVLAYLRRGGFETQVNVIDRETLLKARADPEGYRDLVVRIGGYTDYFTRLSAGMQDEIIQRLGYDGF